MRNKVRKALGIKQLHRLIPMTVGQIGKIRQFPNLSNGGGRIFAHIMHIKRKVILTSVPDNIETTGNCIPFVKALMNNLIMDFGFYSVKLRCRNQYIWIGTIDHPPNRHLIGTANHEIPFALLECITGNLDLLRLNI